MNVFKVKYLKLFPEDYGTLSYYHRSGFNIYSLKQKTVCIHNTPNSLGKKVSSNKDFNKISIENLKYLKKFIDAQPFFKRKMYQLIFLKISLIKRLTS